MTVDTEVTQSAPNFTSGDSEEWRALYDLYCARVWTYVSTMLGTDKAAVADVVQETFLAAARAAHQFDPERGTHWGWLSRIAHNQAALYWRRVGIRRIEPGEPRFDDSAGGGALPDEQLQQAETIEQVRCVLAAMPGDYASLLEAKYADGRSVAELVELFGGTTEGVRSKLAKARREFRRRFDIQAK